ncbi:MAG: hypothetical protein PHE54_03715 [Bacilli bacterium]|nr:hypothetical protein [Bacilli bacterium]
MKIFEITWIDYKNIKTYVIGILAYDGRYIFRYEKNQIYESINNGFRPFIEFPDINKIYYSNELFQTFYIRLPKGSNHNLEDSDAELATDRIKIRLRTDVNKK